MSNFKNKIPPYIIKVLVNYFQNRTFTLTNGDFKSKEFEICSGVPPGSILGNLLYTLFINEIGEVINLPYTLYCDDLAIYTECSSFEEGTRELNECLNKFNEWCIANNLKINVSKTKYMIFHKSKDYRAAKEPTGDIFLNGEKIELVSNFKYLGINIDSTLSYKFHCEQVEKKLNAALGKMYSIKRCISPIFLKTIISAYFVCILEFGIIFWSPNNPQYVNKFQKKINRFLLSYFYPSCVKKWYTKQKIKTNTKKIQMYSLLDRISLLSIDELITLSYLKFIFKMKNQSIFEGWFVTSGSRGKSVHRFKVPVTSTSIFKTSVQSLGIKIWNEYFPKVEIIINKPNWNEYKSKYEIFVDACKEIIIKERKILFM